jgi:hypothetical protein
MIDTLTQEQAHTALVRAALAKQKGVRDPDALLSAYDVDSRVAYSNIPLPDGTGTMMISTVVILSVKLKDVTDTPVPTDRPKP